MSLVAALVDDLMFVSRIREAARGSGVDVRTVRTVEAVRQASREGAALVILDLDSPRLPWRGALAALADDPDCRPPMTVGFFGHVHAETAEAARSAGCGLVLARSAFVQRLPGLLAELPEDDPSPARQ